MDLGHGAEGQGGAARKRGRLAIDSLRTLIYRHPIRSGRGLE